MDDIISPNTATRYTRDNPICGRPKIRFRNDGAQVLSGLTIHYGIVGGPSATHQWLGNLASLATTEAVLPGFNNGQPWPGDGHFWVALSSPNGLPDENPHNDTLMVPFQAAAVLPAVFSIDMYTNLGGNETRWYLYDEGGALIQSRTTGVAQTQYVDEITLDDGCYELLVTDQSGDGLSFFANNDGTGWLRINNIVGTQLYDFEPNFGNEFRFRFVVDELANSTTEQTLNNTPASLHVLPNPNTGDFRARIALPTTQAADVDVLDLTGRVLWSTHFEAVQATTVPVSLQGIPAGVYVVRLRTTSTTLVQRLVVE
jgi:hypothetical protein